MDVMRRAGLVLACCLSSGIASAAPATGDMPQPGPGDGTPTPNRPFSGTPSTVPPPTSPRALDHIIDRPHTIAELEAGVIALPNAPISPGQRGGDTPIVGRIGRGDATLQTGIHILYRFHRDFILGAGAIFAPSPTSDQQYGGLSSLSRTHSRSYLFLGVEGRYVPLHYKSFEAWVGLSGGGVIVADTFSTKAPKVPPILGTPDVTIRTEGFALGVQAGGTYYLSENWLAGANVRGYHWILPEEPQCSPIGDCATLGGSVQVFEIGLTIGYRLPL
ncbi:MAG: hypothetical protein KIT84_12895 [Labilithrix sp.]|nr:hypothetical protein [Labilithrix sp.]MCW5811912.1 hypothetical protein [Labilithrix sp.]